MNDKKIYIYKQRWALSGNKHQPISKPCSTKAAKYLPIPYAMNYKHTHGIQCTVYTRYKTKRHRKKLMIIYNESILLWLYLSLLLCDVCDTVCMLRLVIYTICVCLAKAEKSSKQNNSRCWPQTNFVFESEWVRAVREWKRIRKQNYTKIIKWTVESRLPFNKWVCVCVGTFKWSWMLLFFWHHLYWKVTLL